MKRAQPVDEAFEDDGAYDDESDAESGSEAGDAYEDEDIDERRVRLSKKYI